MKQIATTPWTKKSFRILLSLSLTCITASAQSVVKTATGAIIHPSEGSAVRVQVFGDSIFRVTAVPDDAFPDRPSLITTAAPNSEIPFTLNDLNGEVILSSSALSAHISKQTGAVSFFDAAGTPLLKEPSPGGKHLPLPP